MVISATKLKLYLQCRAQYYDRYVRGVKDVSSTSALMGTALHYAVQQRYAKDKNPRSTFDRYFVRMYDWWITSGVEFHEYQSFQTLLHEGRKAIAVFPFDMFQPIALERKFKHQMTHTYAVSGIVDIVLSDGFVDIKTSKRQPTQAALNNDPQFILYAYHYYVTYGVWPEKAIWYHARNQQYMYFDVHDIETRLFAVMRDMNRLAEDTFEDITPEQKCAQCPVWCARKNNATVS